MINSSCSSVAGEHVANCYVGVAGVDVTGAVHSTRPRVSTRAVVSQHRRQAARRFAARARAPRGWPCQLFAQCEFRFSPPPSVVDLSDFTHLTRKSRRSQRLNFLLGERSKIGGRRSAAFCVRRGGVGSSAGPAPHRAARVGDDGGAVALRPLGRGGGGKGTRHLAARVQCHARLPCVLRAPPSVLLWVCSERACVPPVAQKISGGCCRRSKRRCWLRARWP